MSRRNCCVPLCPSSGPLSNDGTKLSYHTFPVDEKLKKQWIVNIKRDVGKSFQITKSTKVCSLHFKQEEIEVSHFSNRSYLLPGSVPTLFECWDKVPHLKQSVKPRSNRKALTSVTINPLQESERQRLLQDSVDEQKTVRDLSGEHTRADHHILENPTDLEPEEQYHQEKEPTVEELKCQLQTLQQENGFLKERVEHLQTELHTLKEDLKSSKCGTPFGIDKVDECDVQFFTGFPSRLVFDSVLEFVNPGENCSNIRYDHTIDHGNKKKKGGKRSLTPENEFFLFLCRVRLGLFETDLAYRFQISQSTVSSIIIAWTNYLYLRLGSIKLWPSKESVNKSMPAEFKVKYPDTRVIIDCTEIKVAMPSSLSLQSQTYSNYKGTNTLKGLIGIAPQGGIVFVSELFTGNISDREITERSGLLRQEFQAGDAVMADKGFAIQDLLDPLGVKLNIPAFLGKDDQLEAEEVMETQAIASLRIHVERAIGKIRNFHIFDRTIPLSLVGSVNQLWTVCALLTLFQKPIISSSS